jgi:hypothetical protein
MLINRKMAINHPIIGPPLINNEIYNGHNNGVINGNLERPY